MTELTDKQIGRLAVLKEYLGSFLIRLEISDISRDRLKLELGGITSDIHEKQVIHELIDSYLDIIYLND